MAPTTNSVMESMVDEYLDCTGKKRVFRLSLYAIGNFLDAVELRSGEPTGWRFVLPVQSDKPPPWGEMQDRIREHLSRRDVVRDSTGKLQLLHRRLRAQVSEIDQPTEPKLSLLIDDLEITWEDLGELLRPSSAGTSGSRSATPAGVEDPISVGARRYLQDCSLCHRRQTHVWRGGELLLQTSGSIDAHVRAHGLV